MDFSFSGLKTAALRWVEARGMEAEIEGRRRLGAGATVEELVAVTPRETLDMIASFQWTVVEELLKRAEAAAGEIGARSVIITGGVASNRGLRAAAGRALGYPVYFPTVGMLTDNAAMIAAAAFVKLGRGEFAGWGVGVEPNLRLA